ncbi:MAG: preprotein translocase subunit SecA [Planctomycetota bacterium]
MIHVASKAFAAVFGTRNDRLLKRYRKRVEQINEQEPVVRRLTDAQLREKTAEFRRRITDGEKLADLLPEVMAVAREAMDRAVGIRNIFNPEHAEKFDPSRLPANLQPVYADLKEQAAATEPQPVLGGDPAPGHLLIDVPNTIYDAVRELYPESRPPFRARPFDVQLIGGTVLGEGKIAEMKTGEGKTIVAPLACYMAAVDGLKCHIVTVNDYLVQRDRDWVFPFYHALGLTVGAIHPYHQQPPQLKARAYECDAVYGTNSEFGFDYLRDNMKMSPAEQVQKRRDFCIVDEIDSILVDEARTPLIISGPAHQDAPKYAEADKIAKHLVQMQREWDAVNHKVEQVEARIKGLEGDIRNARDKAKVPAMRDEMKKLQADLPGMEADRDQHTQYFERELDKKQAHLTHHGVAEAQKVAGIGSFYVGNNMDFPHLLENALRAHVVYKRDKDYVVQDGEVVIVDEFTGRLMVGRQWSDGLHQAVEAKEGVKIKQETQTLATVTIQNFFKLYQRLAGMTGTAITEATEFNEIYKLDVVAIPTNKPIARTDRDDLIFLSTKDKNEAIVDEVKRMHDLGRPVLVGTTSVEKSEQLSAALKKKHGIQHSVLNAKAENAEREGNIVEDAGHLGAVMIATNMAGRGTDIKLQPIDRAALVDHWQRRDLLPKQAKADMADDELVAMSYRHQAIRELGLKPKDVESMSDDELKLRLFRHWCVKDAWIEEKKAESFDLDRCVAELDKLPDYDRHRLAVWTHGEQMGGLHIVGTERHESRRIDNQLRGRSGRQGDNGSSRFFISLEDDLMKMFAGKTTLRALSALGMKEGDALEHRWVSNSVQRAQRKVEERNYEIRKNLLEYDEIMEVQRSFFYGLRQDVLESKGVDKLVFDYLDDAIADAVETYLASGYVKQQAAEWCRAELDISVDPSRLHLDDIHELESIVRREARNDADAVIDVTLGEYMDIDADLADWDLKGLRQWAMSKFNVDMPVSRLRGMKPGEIKRDLSLAAGEQLDKKDLSGIAKFLEPNYALKDLGHWTQTKFGLELDLDELAGMPPEDVEQKVLDAARDLYRQREVRYPVEFNLEVAMQAAAQDPNWGANHLVNFAKTRYDLELSPEDLNGKTGQDVFKLLADEAEAWLKEGGKLEQAVDARLAEFAGRPQELSQWLRERFGVETTAEELEALPTEEEPAIGRSAEPRPTLRETCLGRAREALRVEVTQLERFVLLQILDQAWKDHLYAMDQARDSVGLRGYAEKDPRIEYKREGARLFQEMQATVRDRVTELVFRARLTPNVQIQSAYGDQQTAEQPAAQPTPRPEPVGAAASASPGAGQAVSREDLRPDDAEAEGGRRLTRKQRRARSSKERKEDGGGGFKSRKKR